MACEVFAQRLTLSARNTARSTSVSQASSIGRALRTTPNPQQRYITSTCHNRGAPVPDFLLPAFASSRHQGLKSRKTCAQFLPVSCTRSTRPFSSTNKVHAAVITTNPRNDENGNEMAIEITARASNRLKEIMSKDSNPDLALRVTVESGGCHGFQYLMSLTNISAMQPDEDTIFEANDGSGAKVIMDLSSLELLKGSSVDYTMELIGSQFKIVGNPAATSSCGCGTSFDIKM